MAKHSQRQLINMALHRAIEWEKSLADSWGAGTPEREQAEALEKEFESLYLTRGGVLPKMPGKSISIFDVVRRDLDANQS